jgi:translation initiation factor 1 (eIF-1/SUI1)
MYLSCFYYGTCRKDGTKTTTRIRKVAGDKDEFLNELRSVLQLPVPKSGNPREDAIRVRVGGTIEIQGNHVKPVKMWLAGLGF